MNQFIAISKNTFLQTMRQPVYGIIVIVTLAGMALAPSLTGWTLDDDNKLLRDLGLSTLLIQGLFLACFGASSTIHSEVEDKTLLTVVAKPLSRAKLVAGKYLGVFGAIAAAHYLASIAFYMALRNGVLQAAWEKPDNTVLVLGLGLFVLLAIGSAVLNYVYDWRYLPTLITLALPAMTASTIIMLCVDRDWKPQVYEIVQTMDNLPPEVSKDPAVLRGIVRFRPNSGEIYVAGSTGYLVRSTWKGPITDPEYRYLLHITPALDWQRDVKFFVEATRKAQGTEIAKAGILILGALALLTGIAVAMSARFGMVGTFLICILALGAGLASDQLLKPMITDTSLAADILYRLIPNFQIFWMVDALSDEQVIPWKYVGMAMGYGAVSAAATLTLGMAMFETREVG